MSGSGGMSQLFKGIIIGVVLIMAIIGTMTILDSDNPLSSFTKQTDSTASVTMPSEIIAPSITLNPDEQSRSLSNNDDSTIGDLNAEISDNNAAQNNPAPVLEGERTTDQAQNNEAPSIAYGMMELKAIDSNNGQALKANFIVTDQNNVKVAESKNISNTAYRLPSGQYKVETTLTRVDEATKQSIPVLTKSRYIIVRKNSTTTQNFELEPPAQTGVLQVSAKMNDQVIRANFVIQKANGEVVASRNNVTNSLFKLNTGSYKVSVTNGINKDFRSVEVKAGESTQTVFILKDAVKQGKLLVRVFDTKSSKPLRADINISTVSGTVIQDLKSATQTELTLAAGDYKISVIGPNGKSNKKISVKPGQALNEIFRFDVADTNAVSTNEIQINDNLTIKPVTPAVIPPDSPPVVNNKVSLSIDVKDDQTRRPIKSNIYIQTLAGKHLDKKTYVESASFNLAPGVYKVTVRAKNRENNVKTIRVTKDTNINETFVLVKPNDIKTSNENRQVSQAKATPAKPLNNPNKIETGFLNVAMQAPNNQVLQRNELNTHFIVTKINGQKIVELTSVNVGNFKLDVDSYFVTAIYKGKRQKRRVQVRPNQNTRLIFNTTDFFAVKGVLRSRIVNETGRPLKGNLTVRNTTGQVVARATDVSSAVFNLPPTKHTISVSFQGLSGSEVVNINANETTVQTFTIASNNQNNSAQQRNNSRDIKDILKEKLKKEIRRTF